MSTQEVATLPRTQVTSAFDPNRAPVLEVDPGTIVRFETQETRSGALFDRPVGSLFELPRRRSGHGNPVTGPLAIRGARPGDALLVDILSIETVGPGWAGAHADVNPLATGRVPRSLGRICEVKDGFVHFSDRIRLPISPMLGCLGTAPPGEPIRSGLAGRHGGNLDQPIVAPGSRVYLPVAVKDALLYVGDVHACQGDGELSGVGLEIAADVTLRVDLLVGGAPAWPWIRTADRLAVLVSGDGFEQARREAVEAMVSALEWHLGLEVGEALALVSVAGDLRIGQAYGGDLPITLRLELPAFAGLEPR